jgi:FlaA1/EpsC-like NDP-sugar epimerase
MIKVLIIGAGAAGEMVANEIRSHRYFAKKWEIIGFLDDHPSKRECAGIPIIAQIDAAPEVIRAQSVDRVIIAIPSAARNVIERILSVLSGLSVQIQIVPGIFDIIEGNVRISQIRDIQPVDLLGREEVGLEAERLIPAFEGKTVLVTGAGGSIGSEIFRELLKLPVKNAIAFGRGENSIFELISSLKPGERFSYVIGDVRDTVKLRREFTRWKPDIVIHAAAHKHVPLMEEHPDEAVRNNIIGTYNTARMALECGAQRFLMISTDKAVYPSSFMGATKRIAELLTLSMNSPSRPVRFSVVRFGNVLASRGSVVPLFLKQIESGGPVTVTDPEMTRYFMSIPEAARLVLKSIAVSDPGIFVLEMGTALRILDLARKMISLSGYDETVIPIVFTGLRKGEKLNEELSYKFEEPRPTEFDKLRMLTDGEPVYSADQIESMIAEFSDAAASFSKEKIRETLKKYLPEFGSL